ncbi:MAG TPA: FAD-binding oxidoreductase [Pseudonocardiaceae bacterium]
MTIVGAGVVGLITAIRCATAGHRVTVLDRGAIPNPLCTSFDQHRAIRALDPPNVAATRRGERMLRRWLALESLLGQRFCHRVGVLTAWPADGIDAVLGVAAAAGLPVSLVEPDKFPHIVFPAGTVGVVEPDAGALLAERVLVAAAGWLAEQPSVTLRPGCRVTEVDADRGQVVLAGGDVVAADLVLVAGGPWTRDLVDVPVALHRQTMVYLRPPADLADWWRSAPSAGRIGADGSAWLLPPVAGTDLKISGGVSCRQVVTTDDADRDENHWAAKVLAASILSDVDRYRVVAVRRCHYATDPATGADLLTRVGATVWARAACGGVGFRAAPLVADRIAAALAQSQENANPRDEP